MSLHGCEESQLMGFFLLSDCNGLSMLVKVFSDKVFPGFFSYF